MKKTVIVLFIALLVTCGWLSAQPSDTAKKAPTRFKLNFSERFRQESWDNTIGLNDSATDSNSYTRARTTIGALWLPSPQLEVALALTNEHRYYISPKSETKFKKNFTLNEIFVDQLYVKWKDAFHLPLTLTLGRQNIMMGEGFVIFDGGPLDGSRSAYFNAVRADYALGAKKDLVLTAFYMYQPERDKYLPIINEQDVKQGMVEQPEEGFGLYFKGTMNRVGVEAYAFRKNVHTLETNPETAAVNTIGVRALFPLTKKLSLTTETAYQFGNYKNISTDPLKRFDLDRSAFGGYFHLDYKTGAVLPLPATVTLGGIYLGGDDPATTGKYEGWDPAFARWPKWSESWIYLSVKENRNRPAYWTNFASLYGSLEFLPLERTKLLLTFHHLMATERTAPSSFLSGDGRTRGDLFIAKFTYDITKNLSGHCVWESFHPGNFYTPAASSYTWLRFELLLKI